MNREIVEISISTRISNIYLGQARVRPAESKETKVVNTIVNNNKVSTTTRLQRLKKTRYKSRILSSGYKVQNC